ncbi:hypothetical protein MUP01_02040 [Candidatus Bathyarchaeota archaeon]|nr:hypothetical protein [Candidatus Bathyarchaeota archaeon]
MRKTHILTMFLALLTTSALLTTFNIARISPVNADPWFWKPAYNDYAWSGVPDFDQRQWGTYIWQDMWGAWSHCGPVAVANSLWWLDSEYEPNPLFPPPMINDGFPLVKSYNPAWDDHSPSNVQPLIEHLAYLMDTDGRRTGLVHSGTNVNDMQAGLTHYLSWSGVNPKGDINGDGIVDLTDMNLVTAAFPSVPGSPNWNMAADIAPVTIGWPSATDNKVDLADVNMVATNFGKTGWFYEHTVLQPDFHYVEAEVERCQDVVLLIGYWIWTGSTWYREPGGHFVTVAGVDSADMMIALSDPVQDAFETGMIPQGRIPFPHVHPPLEPPYITHNDAMFVSQDIYQAVSLPLLGFPPFPPGQGGTWALVNFASWRPMPPFFAVVEAAVITSPYVIDVAVTNVTTSKTGCLPRETVCRNQSSTNMTCGVYPTVANQGEVNTTFTVTAYANLTAFETQTVTLAPGQNTTLTFTWNTSGTTEYDKYTMSASASATLDSDPSDDTFTGDTLMVTHMGDIDGNKKVEVLDIAKIAQGFGAERVTNSSSPKYRQYWHSTPCAKCPHPPNCDIDDNGKIETKDVAYACKFFGWVG